MSITLKEFMTRGMEKDGAGAFIPRKKYRAGDLEWFRWDPNGTPRDITANIIGPGGVGLGNAFERLILQFGTAIANGDKTVIDHLNQTNIAEYLPDLIELLPENVRNGVIEAGENAQLGDFLQQTIQGLGINPAWFSFAKSHPGFFKSWIMRPLIAATAKHFNIPINTLEDVSDLKSYDMWQHTPGMALAFGIPMLGGAALGHPGMGFLGGLGAAGLYGYYKYHQMQGADNPYLKPKTTNKDKQNNTAVGDNAPPQPEPDTDFDNLPEEERKEKEQEAYGLDVLDTDIESEPHSDEATTAIPGPSPDPNAAPAPAQASPQPSVTTPTPEGPSESPSPAPAAKENPMQSRAIEPSSPKVVRVRPRGSGGELPQDKSNLVQVPPRRGPNKAVVSSEPPQNAVQVRPRRKNQVVQSDNPYLQIPVIRPDSEPSNVPGLTQKEVEGADKFVSDMGKLKQQQIEEQRNVQLHGDPRGAEQHTLFLIPGQPVIKPSSVTYHAPSFIPGRV